MKLNENVFIGLDGLLSHKLRSLLTALGIIFGVAAVIAMLSIGEGARQEALECEFESVLRLIVMDEEVIGWVASALRDLGGHLKTGQ